MEVQRAQEILRSLSLDDEGSFYGSARGLSLGAGLLYSDTVFPLFDEAEGRFKAQAGLRSKSRMRRRPGKRSLLKRYGSGLFGAATAQCDRTGRRD